MYTSPRCCSGKAVVWVSILIVVIIYFLWQQETLKDFSVPYPRPHSNPVPQFTTHGESKCLPEVSSELIEKATHKRATCRKYSPFVTGRARIATVTAHFGKPEEHYREAFETHLLHALVHGTEVRVMCDPMVDKLWNKPAFILNLLMREMLKPEKERLEWIQWADRDTLILDQCRPISSFLPPEKSRFGEWWRRDGGHQSDENATHLLVNNDHNGLNNGVFLLRVNNWAVDLFTAILAFRHYKPDVKLKFTEQSAMEKVLLDERFKNQARYVPQHWFNGYEHGGAKSFKERENVKGLEEHHVRRGDYLVHFAGRSKRAEVIMEWKAMLENLSDVWEVGRVQRDVSKEIGPYWKNLGFGR